MGQSGSGLRGPKDEDDGDDLKRQVDSGDDVQKRIYQLVNVKNGGGKLVEIIKANSKTSSCSFGNSNRSVEMTSTQKQLDEALDKQIHDLVEPLLYNQGRGKLVPLSRIWLSRLGKFSLDEDQDDEPAEERLKDSECNYRWVCWKLEERGFVGETGLHICFLLSTPTHMILAQKLLAMFPMLINDIYTCDKYFGESSLHMAIVNENVRIVRLLLDHGANVHERCLGSFFLPNDQSDKANGTIKKIFDKLRAKDDAERRSTIDCELNHLDLNSNNFTSLDTDYDGYAYWGEYPLSFSACLGLVDCYKLLLAKGANPNRQDSNGNTTLHMAVIADRLDIFDLSYSNGASLSVANKQNLTPLTLAAKLRRVKMFFHILTIQRQVNWIFCNVGFVEVPLSGVDSINTEDGSYNDDSVLSIVVFGSSNEHLQMLDGLLIQLLKVKWETAARGKFYSWLCQFLFLMFVSSIAYITRFDKTNSQTEPFNLFNQINVYSEYVLVFCVFYYLTMTIQRSVPKLGIRSFFRSLVRAPEMLVFTLTCLLILTCIPLRLLEWNQAEDFIAALIMFTLPLKFLFFCRASRSVGPFVVMIYKILVNDVLCFVVFLIIFVAGFSQSFYIIFKTHKPTSLSANATYVDRNYFGNLFDGMISMHMMALNEFSIVFDEFDHTDYPVLARLLFCVYMILVSILLINMLIAMLGKTYQDIASQPNESLRQWARALLYVERMWTNQERLHMMDKYSHRRSVDETTSDRYYGSTWALSEKDREEIDSLKSLNDENKLNSRKQSKLMQMLARQSK